MRVATPARIEKRPSFIPMKSVPAPSSAKQVAESVGPPILPAIDSKTPLLYRITPWPYGPNHMAPVRSWNMQVTVEGMGYRVSFRPSQTPKAERPPIHRRPPESANSDCVSCFSAPPRGTVGSSPLGPMGTIPWLPSAVQTMLPAPSEIERSSPRTGKMRRNAEERSLTMPTPEVATQ